MIIHTPTQKDYDALMRILDTKGYRWASGNSLLSDNSYPRHEKETCINITLKTEVMYGGREAYLSIGKAITPFTEALKILQPMLTLENMPVGTMLKNSNNEFSRVLAALGGEGELAVYVISDFNHRLKSEDLNKAAAFKNGWNSNDEKWSKQRDAALANYRKAIEE
jgi:hypothetical protein